MAKVVITIEDLPNDKVKIVCDPSFETIAHMIESGHPTTDAHGYAMKMINEARATSKLNGPIKMLMPRIGK